MSHGRYSKTTRIALEHSLHNYRHHHGPISERRPLHVQTRNAANNAQNGTLPLTTPSTGRFPQHYRITRTTKTRAEHRLGRSRIRLRQYLASDRWHRDVNLGDLREPTQAQINQLGIPNAEGHLRAISLPRPGTWDSEQRMASKTSEETRKTECAERSAV